MILVGTYLTVYRRSPHRKREGDFDPRRLQSLLDVVVANPWQRLTEMEATPQPWMPYEDRKALAALQRQLNPRRDDEPSGAIALRGPGDDSVEARVVAFDSMYAMLYVPDRFITHQEQPRAIAKQLLSLMPDSATAVIAAEALLDEDRFPRPPHPFEYWPWLAGLTPDSYSSLFSREALLATPAVAVEEDDAGRIWIQFYENLLDYDVPEAQAKMREVHAYLHQHAQNQWLPF